MALSQSFQWRPVMVKVTGGPLVPGRAGMVKMAELAAVGADLELEVRPEAIAFVVGNQEMGADEADADRRSLRHGHVVGSAGGIGGSGSQRLEQAGGQVEGQHQVVGRGDDAPGSSMRICRW